MVPYRCALALGCSPAAGCVALAPPPCIYSDLFPGWHVANEIAKPQVCINSNNSSCDCDKLQPEIEINEYSSSKKLLE